MKKSFLILSTILILPVLSGCYGINGELDLLKSVGFKYKRKILNVPAGHRKAYLDISKNKVKLEVRLDEKKYKIPFQLPRDFKFPKKGEFKIMSAQSKQTVDLDGVTDVEVSKSELKEGWISCTYTISVFRCDGLGNCSCEQSYRDDGEQWARYHDITTKNFLDIDIVSPKDGEKLGAFSGIETSMSKEFLFQGICHERQDDDDRCR